MRNGWLAGCLDWLLVVCTHCFYRALTLRRMPSPSVCRCCICVAARLCACMLVDVCMCLCMGALVMFSVTSEWVCVCMWVYMEYDCLGGFVCVRLMFWSKSTIYWSESLWNSLNSYIQMGSPIFNIFDLIWINFGLNAISYLEIFQFCLQTVSMSNIKTFSFRCTEISNKIRP